MSDKRSVWVLLADIIDRPGVALTNIAAHPRWRWLLPALLAVIAMLVSVIITAPLLSVQTQQVMAEQLNRMSGAQADLVRQRVAQFETPLFLGITATITGLIGLAVGWLVQSGILYFGALISGGDVEFSRILATAPWLGIPFVIETLIQTAWVAANHRLITNQGLSYLVSSGSVTTDARNFAYVALGQATLFRLWHAVLAYVLLRAVGKLGRGAALAVTLVYLALLIGVQLGLASLARLAPSGA
jgi:hypothetical protein